MRITNVNWGTGLFLSFHTVIRNLQASELHTAKQSIPRSLQCEKDKKGKNTKDSIIKQVRVCVCGCVSIEQPFISQNWNSMYQAIWLLIGQEVMSVFLLLCEIALFVN